MIDYFIVALFLITGMVSFIFGYLARNYEAAGELIITDDMGLYLNISKEDYENIKKGYRVTLKVKYRK